MEEIKSESRFRFYGLKMNVADKIGMAMTISKA